MQRDGMKCIPYSVKLWNIIVGSGFYAPWLSAVDSMKHDWMQWILCSMAQSIPIEYSGFHEDSMNARIPSIVAQWIPIVCSGVDAARPKASRLNAVDSMHCEWIQFTPYRLVKCIPVEWSGLHALCYNSVDSMQREEMEPYWMQWILCSMMECSGFNAAWPKASRLNAVDYMQHGPNHTDWMQ